MGICDFVSSQSRKVQIQAAAADWAMPFKQSDQKVHDFLVLRGGIKSKSLKLKTPMRE